MEMCQVQPRKGLFIFKFFPLSIDTKNVYIAHVNIFTWILKEQHYETMEPVDINKCIW